MKMLYIKHRSGKRMNNFALSAILAAKKLGIDFTIANNMKMADMDNFNQVCQQYGIRMVHIDFDRNPLGKDNIKARKELLDLMNREKYDVVHCNTPSGGVVGRICAAEAKIPYVIYMAHGFHFWNGAPLKNWLLYYPVERMLAHFTDKLITINQEDFAIAKTFKYKKMGGAAYVPGVGIDVEKIRKTPCNRANKRTELHIDSNTFAYVTVAELIPRKGHERLIRAFVNAKIKNSVLLICGMGILEEHLKNLVSSLDATDRIKFLGFRIDIYEILKASDAFVFPTTQEGLPVALMEAMAADLPCIASRVRGNVDLLKDSELIYNVNDENELQLMLRKVLNSQVREHEVSRNQRTLENFTLEKAVISMEEIYRSVIKRLQYADPAEKRECEK